MHGILSRTCLRSASSLGFGRFQCERVLQKCRKITVTSAVRLHQSNINNTKDEGEDDQTSTRSMDNHTSDKVIGSSNPKSSGTWSQFATQKYERFAESSTRIIYDFDEEQKRLEEGLHIEQQQVREEISLERGITGVFDVEELVDLLREENARDIVVIKVPDEMKYVTYMVVVTSKSHRHINALAELLKKVYKKKKHARDPFFIVEGKNTGWVALDLGNIALHIMDRGLRETYDLETLWTVGVQYDEKSQQQEYQDPMEFYNLNAEPVQDTFVSHASAETRHNTSSTSQLWEKNT